MATKTRIERSLLLTPAISPTIKEEIPHIAARTIGIVSNQLSENVSPPRCPDNTNNWKTAKSKIKATISQTDHFPKTVLGKKLIFMS